MLEQFAMEDLSVRRETIGCHAVETMVDAGLVALCDVDNDDIGRAAHVGAAHGHAFRTAEIAYDIGYSHGVTGRAR